MFVVQSVSLFVAPALWWSCFLLAEMPGTSVFEADQGRSYVQRRDRNQEVQENSLGMRFIKCPPGEFLMGSPKQERHRFEGEQQHLVRISEAFWLGVEEVSVAQFKSVMGKSLSNHTDENVPEHKVTWYDAEDYCRKLSELEAERAAGRSYRLPTEAEWEYACRAGTKTVYFWGDDPTAGDEYTWSVRNSNRKHHRVGSRRPNPWGFYDMHGSAWEWCSDWYDDLPEQMATDPKGPVTGEYRVLRGGALDSPTTYLRSATRVPWEPAGSLIHGQNIGFRVVLVLTVEETPSGSKGAGGE